MMLGAHYLFMRISLSNSRFHGGARNPYPARSILCLSGNPNQNLFNFHAGLLFDIVEITSTIIMTDTFTTYAIQYSYGTEKIPVKVEVFDDGRKELLVTSDNELFRQIVHRSSLYFDKTNPEHFFEEIGNPPVLFSCFSDEVCAKFLEGLLYTILADYEISLRLLQVSN